MVHYAGSPQSRPQRTGMFKGPTALAMLRPSTTVQKSRFLLVSLSFTKVILQGALIKAHTISLLESRAHISSTFSLNHNIISKASTLPHTLTTESTASTSKMEADFPGLCVQKYVRPVEDMDVSPNPLERTSFPHTAQLSAFERLPLEIRQMVYSWLGYPVGGSVRTKDYVRNPVKDDLISCWLLKKIVSFSLWRWDGTPLGSDPHRAVHFVTKHPLLGIQSGEVHLLQFLRYSCLLCTV